MLQIFRFKTWKISAQIFVTHLSISTADFISGHNRNISTNKSILIEPTGADVGGGGRLPSGIRPPADPKGPPFGTF